MRIQKLLLAIITLSILSACGSDKNALPQTGYRTARAQSSLEIPPDLVNSSISSLQQQAALSETQGALPTLDGVKIRSSGDKRWMEVNANANDTWIKLVDYFNKSGMPILVENKRDGILETDWLGDPDSDTFTSAYLRGKVGDLFGRAPVSDKYTAWLEKIDEQNTTIHLAHKQLKQYATDPKSQRKETIESVWIEVDGDGFKTTKVLREMAAFFSGAEIQTDNTERVVLVQTQPAHILLAEPSGNAWTLVERAIITSPYTLDGEDPEQNLFKIIEPKESGFWNKVTPASKFGVQLQPYGDQNKTRISITSKKGKNNIEREDALPVLWALAGELRRMEGEQ